MFRCFTAVALTPGRRGRGDRLVVRGALGLETRLIGTSWADGPTDGLGAMVGAWTAAEEARKRRVSLHEIDLMREIERYNEVDCRVMYEVISYLRDHH